MRSQRTLAVNSPDRGPNGPPHLIIDSTASRSRVRASGTHASMGRITGPSGGSGARDILGLTSKRWRFGPSRSLGFIPVLPDLLNQIPADEAIGSITIDGAFDTRKCHNAIPDRGANAVIPRVKTPSRGRLFLLVPDPEARPGEFRNTSAARSGEIGRDITGEAASRPRCTALNCLINASWHGTSTNRGCDKNPIQLFMLFQARTSKVPIELLSDLLFLSPSRTSTYSDATV